MISTVEYIGAGYSSIPLTYVLHFPFENEINSFAGIMGIYFFLGLLLLVAGIIMDTLADNGALNPKP
jgi:hypothetical protein